MGGVRDDWVQLMRTEAEEQARVASEAGEPARAAEWEAALRAAVSDGTVWRRGEPLAQRTTLRVGGPADWYVEPVSEAELAALVRVCRAKAIPWWVLGRGSNVVVRDGGVRGVVVCLAHPTFGQIAVAGERLECGAGVRLKRVAVEARRHGVGGLEFLEGIPGSVGGALRMNAGAMGRSLFDVVERVRCLDAEGNLQEHPAESLGAQYRSCAFFRTHVALSAVLRGCREAPETIRARMEGYSRRRWATQPQQPSAGCMFKNPAAVAAGRLIEELGLKGVRVGGARVSEVHGNFVVTEGLATAADVLALVETVRARVREARGIELESEVEVIGEDLPARGCARAGGRGRGVG